MNAPPEWIDKRMANALMEEARIGGLGAMALGQPAGKGLGLAEKLLGGLWVGGTAYLTRDTIEFWPNALNKVVHADGTIDPVVIALTAISDVKFRKGIGTNIVDISTPELMLSIRAYNMPAFAEAICDAADAAQGRQ